MVAVLSYQSRGSIKKLFTSNLTTSNDNSVTIVPQDYTNPTDSVTSTSSTATTTPAAITPTAASAPLTTDTNKSNLKIKVLNGNGISKSADAVKQVLAADGYNIDFLGNARTFSYTDTYIYYKTGKDGAAADIKTLLSTRTSVVKNDDTLCASYDIVVVVGKK